MNHQDWQTLVSAIETLSFDFDPQTLSQRTIAAASKIIPAADSAAFTGFLPDGTYADLMWTNDRVYSLDEMAAFETYIHENPLFDEFILKHRPDTLKITDLMPPDEFERTAIYNEFYRRVGVRNQLVTPLTISGELLITCSMNIGSRDFSKRDKTMLSLLAPHIANAIRNAFAYRRLSGALETEACGVIALNSMGRAVFISEFARRLFGEYFAGERRGADDLPASLQSWIEQMNPAAETEFDLPRLPLKIVNQNGELKIRPAFNKQTGEHTLMLEETRPVSPRVFESLGLTRREAEILFWITQGKSGEVMARLCGIKLRTVQKHVENIYSKLGVETRTAAMLKALECLRT